METAPGLNLQQELQISVTRAQHGGETRGLHFAATALARLFEMPMIAHFLQRAFAVDFLFQPAQRLVHGLAFFKPDFGQLYSLPLRAIAATVGFITSDRPGCGA